MYKIAKRQSESINKYMLKAVISMIIIIFNLNARELKAL